MSEKLTPVWAQYLDLKRQHPHSILFFRLGDFYETFGPDAELCARELEIVLTSRNFAKGQRVPMAGIPHHSIEHYLRRLIERGHHVAICEQIGEAPVRGLFPRQVVRVVTPGTLVEPGMLAFDVNNYLAAVWWEEGIAGVAHADISTGEFRAMEIEVEDAQGAARLELQRLSPAEVLIPELAAPSAPFPGHPTAVPAVDFEDSEGRLRTHFGASTLAAFGLEGRPAAQRAAGAILAYLARTQPAALPLIVGISTYRLEDFMTLDDATRRNLELTETLRAGQGKGSLLGVLDATLTPMGRRLLRQWVNQPLLREEPIRARQDLIQAALEMPLWRAEMRQRLAPIGDLERLTNRIHASSAGPRDLSHLRTILQSLPALKQAFASDAPARLGGLGGRLDSCEELRLELERALVDEPPSALSQAGLIRAGYSDRLDEIAASARHARDWIAKLEPSERERTGIKTLRVGFNRVFGYYIEVTKANVGLVPPDYIRKQTLVNGERYITPDMKEYESVVLTSEERQRELEAEIFGELCRAVGRESPRLIGTARALAELDVVSALAEVAARKGYVRPEVTEGEGFEILDGRHPVVEEFLAGARFVPNDTVFEDGERIRVITGPNMAGKSTYLRQVALITLLAQIGSFVPARSARLGIVDRIFTRIGAQDEIQAGRSTFMVEMVEAAHILHHATRRSLLILDEIGRGTSTYDGLSLAWAVLEYIHHHPRLRSRTLFATHFHELTRLSEVLPGVRNYNVAVTEDSGSVVFLHKIIPGGADKSYGIHVAELAGLPRPVVNRAREILTQLEAEGGQVRPGSSVPVRQLRLFPEKNPLLDELTHLDLTELSPLEALNLLFEWQQKFGRDGGRGEDS